MTARLVEWILRRQLHPSTFPGQLGEAARATTGEVLADFALGVQCCLHRLYTAEVYALEAEVAWDRRCFFWEGYAFGLAADHALHFRRGNPDRKRIIPHYRAMHYTGYGFWNGVAAAYRLPRVSMQRARWHGVTDFDRLSPLIAGGLGFAVAGLARQWNASIVQRLARLVGDALELDAAVHGCGRALWFLYMHNVEQLEALLDAEPQYAEWLCEGVGIAIAFTHLARPTVIESTVGGFSPKRQAALLRGAGVCLHEVTQEDPRLATRIDATHGGSLRDWRDRSAAAARAAGDGPGWYGRYVEQLRVGGGPNPARARERGSAVPPAHMPSTATQRVQRCT